MSAIRFFLVLFSVIVVFSIYPASAQTNSSTHPRASIIIDDFGGNFRGVSEFLDSNIPITVAVMPFLEQSAQQAELAHQSGHEVIIHLPMEPKKGKASWLGPKAITSTLTNQEVRQTIEDAISEIPHVVGLNNHMGSKIVENERIMRIVMEVAKEHSLFIIDSGTSGKSVISRLAKEYDIDYAVRDVFLDDTTSSRHHVEKQMEKLMKTTLENGKAIGIGHVGIKGEETFAGITKSLSSFQKNGIELVPVSHLLDTKIEKDPEQFWVPDQEG